MSAAAHDLLVDGGVGVYGDVAEARNAPPFDFRVAALDLRRNLPGGLAGDLEVSHDRVEGLLVGGKPVGGHTLGVPQDLSAAVADVLQVEARVTRHVRPLAPRIGACGV